MKGAVQSAPCRRSLWRPTERTPRQDRQVPRGLPQCAAPAHTSGAPTLAKRASCAPVFSGWAFWKTEPCGQTHSAASRAAPSSGVWLWAASQWRGYPWLRMNFWPRFHPRPYQLLRMLLQYFPCCEKLFELLQIDWIYRAERLHPQRHPGSYAFSALLQSWSHHRPHCSSWGAADVLQAPHWHYKLLPAAPLRHRPSNQSTQSGLQPC
mmetsp:Transcript_21265/g.63999  ORF Transcript_21265/g.63999 Transcript_21265/m.63999 type:complete len:208 (-) Transcript_21265:126-749(-)